ncbi:putative methyltransferase-domain-containing protein [Epithele typhae]|uniref:putative methyltransferase-domain-containing protein n=1 Tax=Epithele typhae TaxID=378194 RepID=UPI0020086ABA|nr:putative methyltransferase-domain-containing protein [Epithele typhae]KAH9941276.1 putative methyltransferase-domain-containing protein [Epithele typhae]
MSTEDVDDGGIFLGDMFTEPPRPPTPEPTFSTYERERPDDDDWRKIEIRLVGSHPLWGHYLWNASLAFASYLDDHPELYQGKDVLELGAGGALPGLVSAKNGARHTVLTDYPDRALIDNISYNVGRNIPEEARAAVGVEGYIWGHPVEPLLQLLPDGSGERAYDLIILSDLVFNHSQHNAMLSTCVNALAKTRPATVLVFFTHHRPHFAARDMEFFTKAREQDWVCEEILTRKYPPMFPEDPGEEEVRATVHGWKLTRR